tara:strand:+ start:4811 stop:5218 length:408 start_codon:yes stop_codon:yes gene_type:complete
MSSLITSTELKKIEKQARAKARAEAERELREIRNGEHGRLQAAAGHRIYINVTLCPWGEVNSDTYQWGLDIQGTREIRPSIKNIRKFSEPDSGDTTSLTLCTHWFIEPTNGQRFDSGTPTPHRIAHVTVWERERA